MSGVKGRSGRKRKSKNRTNAMISLTNMLPKALEVIEATATGENKDRLKYEAACEIKDSVMGKPRQQTDLDIKGGQEIGSGVVLNLLTILQEKKRELEQGEPKLLNEPDKLPDIT